MAFAIDGIRAVAVCVEICHQTYIQLEFHKHNIKDCRRLAQEVRQMEQVLNLVGKTLPKLSELHRETLSASVNDLYRLLQETLNLIASQKKTGKIQKVMRFAKARGVAEDFRRIERALNATKLTLTTGLSIVGLDQQMDEHNRVGVDAAHVSPVEETVTVKQTVHQGVDVKVKHKEERLDLQVDPAKQANLTTPESSMNRHNIVKASDRIKQIELEAMQKQQILLEGKSLEELQQMQNKVAAHDPFQERAPPSPSTICATSSNPMEALEDELMVAFEEKNYARAASLCEKMLQQDNKNTAWLARTHYNFACAHAMLGNVEKAFIHLHLAFDHCFYDYEQLDRDFEFESLRSYPEYGEIHQKMKQRMIELEPWRRLPTELIEHYIKMFETYDALGNGYLTREEYRIMMQRTYKNQVPPEQIDQIIRVVDVDGDGKITLDEFLNYVAEAPQFKQKVETTNQQEQPTVNPTKEQIAQKLVMEAMSTNPVQLKQFGHSNNSISSPQLYGVQQQQQQSFHTQSLNQVPSQKQQQQQQFAAQMIPQKQQQQQQQMMPGQKVQMMAQPNMMYASNAQQQQQQQPQQQMAYNPYATTGVYIQPQQQYVYYASNHPYQQHPPGYY